MSQEQVLREFTALPPIAQREVMDFIGFLRSRYPHKPETLSNTISDIANEPFIGILI